MRRPLRRRRRLRPDLQRASDGSNCQPERRRSWRQSLSQLRPSVPASKALHLARLHAAYYLSEDRAMPASNPTLTGLRALRRELLSGVIGARLTNPLRWLAAKLPVQARSACWAMRVLPDGRLGAGALSIPRASALVDALIDLPFALPTAVSGIALTAVFAPNGWLGGSAGPRRPGRLHPRSASSSR